MHCRNGRINKGYPKGLSSTCAGELVMKSCSPPYRIVGTERLVGDLASSPWVYSLEHLHNPIVVVDVHARRAGRVGRTTGRERHASGDLRVRLFHQILDVPELLHERAGGLGRIAAQTCDPR